MDPIFCGKKQRFKSKVRIFWGSRNLGSCKEEISLKKYVKISVCVCIYTHSEPHSAKEHVRNDMNVIWKTSRNLGPVEYCVHSSHMDGIMDGNVTQKETRPSTFQSGCP